VECGDAKLDLVAHGHDDAAVAGAAAGDAVHPPARAQGDLGGGAAGGGAVDAELDLTHLERDERGRVEAAVHVGLVAGHVGAVDGARVDDDRVGHGGRGHELQQRRGGVVVPVHRQVRARRRQPAPVGQDQALGELEAVLHRAREGLVHGWPPGRGGSGWGAEAGGRGGAVGMAAGRGRISGRSTESRAGLVFGVV